MFVLNLALYTCVTQPHLTKCFRLYSLTNKASIFIDLTNSFFFFLIGFIDFYLKLFKEWYSSAKYLITPVVLAFLDSTGSRIQIVFFWWGATSKNHLMEIVSFFFFFKRTT